MKLRAQARVLYGIDRGEFWLLTPREWVELSSVRREVEQRKDWRTAVVAWAVVRSAGDKKSKITDFMADQPKTPKTEGSLLGKVVAINAALGGKDLRKR